MNPARLGELNKQRIISEYSVTVDREVINDRSNARYLIEENISDHVFFDLKKGLETFIDKDETVNDESCLTPLCKWTCAQRGNDLKKIFGGAEFAAKMGTLMRIAETSPQSHMMMVRSELGTTDGTLKLCCMTEIDALSGEGPVELKTAIEAESEEFYSIIRQVMRCELSGVQRVVFGLKDSDNELKGYHVLKVVNRQLPDMKEISEWAEETRYGFIFDVLSQVKDVLQAAKACEIKHDPTKKHAKVSPISMEEANERGYGVTPEFMARFNHEY